MQRTIWEWLGIERTTDKSRIRKAYAEQAKKYHPEEFPEEAQALRKAYKDAMAMASASGNASDWADSHVGQGIPFGVREPEPDTEAEYVYVRSVPSGKPPEVNSKSESEYIYGKSVSSGIPQETDSKSKPEYVYGKSVPSGMPSETDSRTEPEYSFANPELPPDRAKRIAVLKKRMETIYGTEYRNFARDWRQAFADFLEPEDLKDIRAVREILMAIEPMRRLRNSTWEIIQTELFRFQEDTAPWQLLQERFDAVRRCDALAKASADTPQEDLAKTPGSTPQEKTSLVRLGIIFFSIMFLVGLSTLMDEARASHRQQEMRQEWQQLLAEQIQIETPAVPVSRGALQAIYTRESPWELDLNRDEIPDHIYYDPDRDLFMVELYDAATETYNSYGSLKQYLEENPDTRNIRILSYLAGGENGS